MHLVVPVLVFRQDFTIEVAIQIDIARLLV
jgi:hypothetical protein